MPFPLRVVVAVLIAAAILWFGVRFIRSMGRPAGRSPGEQPERVEELDVFFVCGECGTELKVTMLGELQVPRHCGEPMNVERRPATGPALN